MTMLDLEAPVLETLASRHPLIKYYISKLEPKVTLSSCLLFIFINVDIQALKDLNTGNTIQEYFFLVFE